MEQTRVYKEGLEAQIGQISGYIQEMQDEANLINTVMYQLTENWDGQAYDETMATYEDVYKNKIMVEIPERLNELRDYINNCMNTIIEVDAQLAGH